MPRRFVGCNRCEAGAWLGPAGEGLDAWCEACQRPAQVPVAAASPCCEACEEPLTVGEPRFEEIYGELQNLVAVLEAWSGDPSRLAPLVPERPRFLTDLSPPEPHGEDSAPVRSALESLRAGAFRVASAQLAALLANGAGTQGQEEARLWRALAVARQRLDDLAGAEEAFSRAIDLDPDDLRARLDRGTLRARRGAFGAARADLLRAGSGHEAGWNRAALVVLEAVATGVGLPDAETLRQARAEAGPPSSYWSDHTVGRLLFTLLVERARARGVEVCADARTLRAAEQEMEFQTFDDRALLLIGYASLGLVAEAEAVAAPLAAAVLARLGQEPFARGAAGAWLHAALETAATEVEAKRPSGALEAVGALLERDDVRHYRIPCARCGRGSIGVERVEEDEPQAEPSVRKE